MKKHIMIMMVILALMLTACGGSGNADAQMEITRNPKETTAQTEPAAEVTEAAGNTDSFDGPFVFVTDGVRLVPGVEFDASVLPEPQSVSEVPSCAIEGTDNVYNYGTYEITAFKDSSGELIYSIFLLDANLTTPEGVALGDRLDKVIETYGENYQVNNAEYFYTSEGTILSFIVQNDLIISIEYRMDV